MNALAERSLLKWMVLAARSLPVPLSPRSSTVDDGLAATFWSSVFRATIGAESPTIRLIAYGSDREARSALTSRLSLVVSSAFCTTSASSSRLKGLLA